MPNSVSINYEVRSTDAPELPSSSSDSIIALLYQCFTFYAGEDTGAGDEIDATDHFSNLLG